MSDALDTLGLERFLWELDREAVLEHISADGDVEDASFWLATYLNEAHLALQLLRRHYEPGMRVLEVGGGICAFARFARRSGVDLSVVEPIDPAFGFIARAFDAVEASLGGDLPVFRMPVEDLSAAAHGRFDVVYSVNVLEHLDDVARALDAIDGVLVGGGVQAHTCPNYTVPYEPHVGVPLVPFAPATTSRLWARRQSSTSIWRSLNWISARQVRGWARSRRRTIRFERGVMADMATRLASDELVAARHRNLLGRLVAARPVRVALRHVPARFASPMTFAIDGPAPAP